MLTYYHYLLGSFLAATCVVSALVGSTTSASSSLTLSLPAEAESTETLDVSYRGSGRVDDAPKEQQDSKKELVAHRGSGRIDPASM